MKRFGFLGVMALLILVPAANATTISFTNLENNSGLAETLASQLFLDVTYDDINQEVAFLFKNGDGDGDIASTITEIDFRDTLSAFLAPNPVLDPSAGVVFKTITNANASEFLWDDVFFAAQKDGNVANGINDGGTEYLKIVFDLNDGALYSDLLTALTNSSDVRSPSGAVIGLHVQSIANTGNSDKFYNYGELGEGPIPEVPEPTSIVLLGIGLIGLGIAGKMHQK
ncbi:MAG: PEP-CTERM sorting domain-containing protein [Acidobacteria bacterium]|nr:PEP-CTERM sorting domain-containing protein [Acidobacteriota bacterium]